MPPCSSPDAVMIGDAVQPLAAQFAILAARDQGRILARDRRLIDEAVERPGLHLALVELAVVQKAVERMQVVIAHRADGAQRRLERVGGHGFRWRMDVHEEISIPSNAISQPAAFTFASSGDPSMRIGFELLMWMRMRRTCAWRASDFERSSWSRHGHVTHAPPGFVAKAIGDHFVIGEQGAVEKQHICIGDARVEVLRNMGATGRIDESFARRFHRDADRRLADVVGADVPLFEPQRDLAGNGEQFELDAGQRFEWFAETRRRGAARRRGRPRRTCDWRRSHPASPACRRSRSAGARAAPKGPPRNRPQHWSERRRGSANGARRLSDAAPASPGFAGAGRSRR